MPDTYTSYSRQGYFSRIGGAIKGVLFGGVLFLVSFVVLFVNEGRAVHRESVLKEVSGKTVSVDPARVDPANQGKPVYFTGNATGETLTDKDFGVSQTAVHLQRKVEMYQWKENKKTETKKDTIGGGETKKTTYSYENVWSEKLLKSGEFEGDNGRASAKYANPPEMPVTGQTLDANVVMVGAFKLPTILINRIDNYQDVPAGEPMLSGLSDELKGKPIVVAKGAFYLGDADTKPSPAEPRVGDVRVSFRAVPPGPVSVIAQQSGSTLEPYHARDGEMAELHVGTHSQDDMIKTEQSKNTTLTWALRLVGFVVMWIGLALVLNPLKVLADVIGILGDIAGVGIGLVTGVLAFSLSLVTIGAAWLFYRPLLGIGLLAAAAGGLFLLTRLRKQSAARRATAGIR